MNMSYCRFHNTRIAVDDCLSALSDWEEKLSEEEIEKGKKLFRNFLEYCAEANIIDGYDDEMIDAIFNEKNETEVEQWD